MKQKDIYDYDIIVVGGGVSGCEASYTSASHGARTLLLSISMDSIGYMPFSNIISNEKGISAVGKTIWDGLIFTETAKNNLLDINEKICGERSKPARKMIIDRKRQMMDIKRTVEIQEDLLIRQGLVTDLEFKDNIYNITTSDGTSYKSRTVIIACGTFLDSYIFWGDHSFSAGRPGEITSKRLFINLMKSGIKFEKAVIYGGPKIDGRIQGMKNTREIKKVYYAVDMGESSIKYMKNSILDKENSKHREYGNYKKMNLPIEEIISRFNEKEEYKIYIVPEGKDTVEMYIDGFNTAEDEETQLSVLRKIEGLKNTIITRPGYGTSYNILSPLQINKSLESKNFPGLFFSGKINGAACSEDSAAQGYIAGLNAFRRINNIN